MENRIYMDNAATTRVDDDIVEQILPYLTDCYANASSVYKEARIVKNAIDVARKRVATLINSKENEIYFTSGGSESDNWAICGILSKTNKKHIITSKIEHHAILNTFKHLEKQGYKVTYIDVDEYARVKIDDIQNSITSDTALISIMMANNEVGSIQDIKKICEISHTKNIIMHTDAVQSLGKIDIDVKDLGVDLLSISGHKIHALKGIGALYINDNIHISPIIYGGSQEKEKRAGTENVSGIVSLGLACEKLTNNSEERKQMQYLRDYFIEKVLTDIDDVILSGHKTNRLVNNINFCFKNIDSKILIILLDKQGICASVGSACTSGSIKKSHVLEAMNISEDYINGNIRFSLSKYTTKEEIDKVIEILTTTIAKLRM